MGLFSSLFGSDINASVQEARTAEGTLIIDVRSKEEFRQGHIEGAVNVPLDSLRQIEKVAPDKTAPLYVYCLSGARSAQACRALPSLGYENVTNMGGINRWSGPVARGGN